MPLRSLAALGLCAGAFALALAYQPEPAPPPKTGTEPLPLASAAPRYWKGNLHTHTLWSDGDDFPEMVCDWYKRHGYDFLSLTEHNVLAEGDKWADAESNATRKKAVEKYEKRFGARWPEFRTKDNKKQVRLKPHSEYRALFDEPGKFLLIPGKRSRTASPSGRFT